VARVPSPWCGDVLYSLPTGALLVYAPARRNRLYTMAPDWRLRRTRGRRFTGELLCAVRAFLESES
jgi:hypothetical protein